MNQSVVKALKLLNLFTEDTPELSLKQIAEEANIPKPTAYRLLSALEECDFLMKTKDTEHDSRYRLGLKLLELGHLVSDQLELREIALPYMEKLAQEINEVVHLVIVYQNEATYIEKVDSTRAVRLYTRVGKRAPLYLGSGPKLLLAYLEKDKKEEVLEKADRYPFIDQAPMDKRSMDEELQEVRNKGYAFSAGEQDPETTGVSYPICDHHGKVIAALAISGLSSHFEGVNLQEIKSKSKQTADKISSQLGYKQTT